MPLLGQKIYLAKSQEKRSKKGKGTFEIPFTNEVFTSKDEYDKQLQSYKQPIWTCQCTGFTGLTYEEALRSETEVHKRLSSKFPRSLEKPVLELVHHRAAPLDVIVDEAQQRIQSVFEVGEMVELKVKVRGKVIRGKIVDAREMSDDEIPTSDKENSVTEDHPYSSPQHSKQYKSIPFQYNIQLDGEDKVISAIPGKDLLHTSALPSRDLLQLFIRASAVQAGSKPSSPWVVSEDLVRKFGLLNKINEVMLSPFKVVPSSLVKLTSVKRPAQSHEMASKPKKRKLSENNSGVSKFKQSSLMDFNKKDNMVLSVVLQREQNTSNMGLIQSTMATPPKHNPNIMASPEKVQLDHSYSSPPPHLKAASRSPPKKHRSPKEKKDTKSSKRSKVDKVDKKTKKAPARKKSKSSEDRRTTKTSRSKTHSKKSSKKKADSSGSDSDDIVVIVTKSSKSGKTESKQDDIIVVDDSPVRSAKKTPNEKKAGEVSSKTDKKKLPTKRKLTDHFKAASGSSPKKSPSKLSKAGSSAKSESSSKSPAKAKKAKSTPVKTDKSKKKSASKAEVEEVSSSEGEDFEDNDKKKSKATVKKQPAVKTKKEAVKKASQKKKQGKDTKSKKSASDKVVAQKETPKKETPKKETSQKATPKKTPAKATPKKTPAKATPKKTDNKVTPKKTPSKSTPNKTPKKALVKKSTPKKMTPTKAVSKKTTPGKSTPKKTLKETPKKTPKKTTPAKKTPKKLTPGVTPGKSSKKPFKQATLFDVGAKKSAKKDGAGMITKVTSPKSPRQPPIANKMFRIKSKDQEKYKKLVARAAKELTEQQVKNLRPEIRDDVLIKFKLRMEKIKWHNMSPEERGKILQEKKEEMRRKKNEAKRKKAEELRKLKEEKSKRYEDQDLKLKPLPVPKLVSMPEGLPNALFGDIAMVVEFLNCYSGLLMPEDPYPIAADPLMKALVYGKEGFAYLARVLVILLKTLLQDEIAEDYRELSMKLSDMTVNMHTSSELLRLSLRRSDHEHNHNDDNHSDYSDSSDEDDDDVPYKLVEKLETCEFFELEPEEKLELLVCVCHRILGSYAIQDFMEEKQRAAAKLWREKIQSLKEKNDKLKEEKQKKKEQKEAEKLEKEKLKEQQKEEQQGENKEDSSEDKNKVNGEVPADKDSKKKKPKKVAKKENNPEVKEEKPVESKPPPDEELDLASVVKRRRVLAAKLKAEKAEQDKLDRERRIKEQEAYRKQRDEQLFQKNFEDGIQLAKLSLRQSPVGTDRSHSRYWIFSSVIPGLFIEKGWADKDVGYNPNSGEQEKEEEIEAGSSKEDKQTEHTIPKVGQNLWFQYSSVKEIDNLLDALNNQGIRESALYTELKKRYEDITRMTYLSRRSGPDLRDSDGPKELLDSFREDLSDVELNVRQGQLGGVKNFEKWEKKLMSSTKLKDLGVLMIESQEGVNPRFLQGIMAPVKRKPQQTNREDEDDDSEEDDQSNEAVEKSEKLLKWIEAVKCAPTLSRLHVFVAVYETCIKWEKSAANAKCKICRKKGDDNKVLLCDECNQPFHLFCLRPALTAVPKGEWKCPACAPSERRASRSRTYFGMESSSEDSESSEEDEIEHDETCAVCEEDGELVECFRCPAVYHRECHDPPLKNYPRGRWKCSDCLNPGRSRRANKARQKRAAERRRQRVAEEPKPQRSSRNTKATKQAKKTSKNVTFDSEVAEGIISKLMCYRGSAPFRTSPDKTEAPDYDEIIKIPMDLHMVKNKCCSDEYDTYEEFFTDVKLIFANAHEYYQESDYVSKQATKLEDYFVNQIKWAVPDAISVWESLGQESFSTQQNGPTNQRATRRSSRR